MNPNVIKYLKLVGIAILVSGAYLAWDWFSHPVTKAGPEVAAVDPATGETAPPEETTGDTPTELEPLPEDVPEPSLEEKLAQLRAAQSAIQNPYDAAYKPATAAQIKAQAKAPVLSSNSSGGGTGGTGGSGSSKKGGSGSGGGSGGGSSGGSGGGSGGTAVSPSVTPSTTTEPTTGVWIQTGPDPRGETLVGNRHNTSCTKYKNVPGRDGTKNEGTICPICGG